MFRLPGRRAVLLLGTCILGLGPAAAAQVRPGIEVLVTDSVHLIRGKRVGLITNHSGRARDGTSSIDLLFRTPGVRLTALFGPEHGLRGVAEAGERVASTVDSATGVPVYSLYGTGTNVPVDTMLRNVDVLVYDIQDVGARVYTYQWTMALSAAAVQKPFIVVDRPDPIRADRVEGNILDPKYATFVGRYPVALRYGLTPGELIRYLVGEKLITADVTVIPMQGYRRDMWFAETGLAWRNPSPNIRDIDAALLYPGTVFFEGTNLSEGRGTDAPFTLVGAPWLRDVRGIVAELNGMRMPGVVFEATERVIERGAKLSDSAGRPVPFIRIRVTDRNAVQPVALGIRMLRAIHARHADMWEWRVAHFDRLAGTDELRAAVQAGTIDDLIARWEREAATFREASRKYWLYPSAAEAGRTPSATVRTTDVAPGVVWTHEEHAAGPVVVDVVTIDLRQCSCDLRQVRARDSLQGRETLTAMVARQSEGAEAVVAAINADFFNLTTGESENNVVVNGEWWKGVRGTTTPNDAWDNAHTQFGVSADGRPLIDRFVLHGTAIRRGAAFPITGVNHFSRGGVEAAILFTPRYGRTPVDTTRLHSQLLLRRVRASGDTVVFVQTAPSVKGGGNPVPADGAILATLGPRSTVVGNFEAGDTIRVILRAATARGDGPLISPRAVVGGWPRILRGGENVAAQAPWSEATISSNAEVKHPRSAIGFTRDTSRLILVTVDGRQAASVGVTLVELADLMKAHGAWDAMNFDGGGSSTLVVRGAIANKPSDTGGEREVASALLVVRRR